ncbi:MAG: hypothetical protein ACR2OA_00645 [Rubripirellula sp.]|jgi:hypothetical protein
MKLIEAQNYRIFRFQMGVCVGSTGYPEIQSPIRTTDGQAAGGQDLGILGLPFFFGGDALSEER